MAHLCSIFVLFLSLFAAPLLAAEVAGFARVMDGDSLRIGQTDVRLHGIDAPEAAQTCGRAGAGDDDWNCGTWAADALRTLVAGHQVICDGRGTDRYGRILATCRAGGAEVNRAMVQAGAATAYRRYSSAYVADERAAQRARLGIWAGTLQAPEDYRRTQDRAAGTAKPVEGCRIKGNISGNGLIYHRPGQEHYAKTGIDTGRGERWFCTEAEARAAGWRAALR